MAECVFCKEEFADNPDLEPVVYAPCQQCDVLYCRPCLEEYVSKYESQCSVCKTKVKVRRSITMIADGEERRRAHDRRAANEASQVSDTVRRVAPVAGELLEQAVDPAFLLQRRQADDDAASRREAERLQREFNQAPSRGPEEPDAATRALMEQLQREDAEARRRAAAEPRPQPPPAKRRKSSDGLVQTTISLQPRAVIDVDDPGDETQLSGDPPPPVDETQSPDADWSAPPAVPLGEASRSPPARPPAPAMDLTQDSSGDDEAAPPRRSPPAQTMPAVRSPPPRPRADDDELAYFRSQGARNASLHESSSSDDDDSLPRRSRSRERPAPRPSEVIVID
ncbi:unnamed protein product [Pelagomonas calceolata]|uniref:RING-type domain-containing protein n=1 Tax=Pelagomonas calceolata TaxID=35677 RepID=A0A8J2T2R0_9STRA|nr:unnamed protein product [Pelagomonas calceolata]